MKKLLNNIGIFTLLKGDRKPKKSESKEKVIKEKYEPATDEKMASLYLDYLKNINQYQHSRREAIENKNSQLVGQASIVTTIFSLFIPLLVDSFDNVSIFITIPISMFFLLVLFFYLLSVLHAIRTLNIAKFKYPGNATTTITKKNRDEKEIDFINAQIKDLIYIINRTGEIDNQKGDNLIYASRCFQYANIGFGLFSVFILFVALFFYHSDSEEKSINIDEIKVYKTYPIVE